MDNQLYHRFYEVEEKHWWFVARRAILQDLVTHLLQLQPGAKILDVGCGTGAVLASFSGRFQAFGIDTSELAVEYCRKRGLVNTSVCALSDFTHVGYQFDLITMLDVIEHIDDDLLILKQARERLTSSGRILLTVPAYQFLWGPYDIASHHKRRYTRTRLKETLLEAGFVVEKVSYFNCILFPLALLQRGIESYLAHSRDESLTIPPRPFNNLLRSVFNLEKFVLRRASLPFGLSVLGIARKG